MGFDLRRLLKMHGQDAHATLSVLGQSGEDEGARFFDDLLLLGDERIEHGDFLGVLALLVFAEEEEVGLVRGTPAVEEEAVFLDDGGSQCGEGFVVGL